MYFLCRLILFFVIFINILFFIIDFQDDEVSVKELELTWMALLGQNLGLVCLVDKNEDFKNPNIAGINVTYCKRIDDLKIEHFGVGKKTTFGLKIVHFIYERINYREILNVDQCLTSFGLLVLNRYRGMEIGEQLLRAR